MPTPTFTPGDTKEDDTLNPGQQYYDRRFNDLAKREESGTFDDIAKNYNTSTADSATEDRNIAAARQRETENTGWNTRVSGSGKGSGKLGGRFNIKNLKKSGPIATILAIIGVGGFGATVLFSPAMLLVNMKETLADKFNSQLAVLDARSNKIIAKKIGKTVTSGVCSPVTIRCKYKTMSRRQLAKLDKAGIKVVDADGNQLAKRGRGAAIELDGKRYDASELQRELRNNPRMRSAFNRAYNPKVTAFSDKIASKVNSKLKISKKNAFEGAATKEDLNKKIRGAVSGETFSLEKDLGITKNGDNYVDKDGNTLTEEEVTKRRAGIEALDKEALAQKELAGTGKKMTKSAVKGAVTITALGANGVDTLCTGYRTIRGIGFAAKYIGMLQLSRYAFTFMNTADAIKAGDATPEQVEYLSTILTSTNSKGKSASDSYGYHYAAYGDVSGKPSDTPKTDEEARLADEVLRYTNGQLVSKNAMASIIGGIDGAGSTDGADSVCSFVKSGWGQTLLFGIAIVGAGVAIASGGFSLGWGAGAQVGASTSLAVALGLVTPKLIDMAAGTLVTGDENGNEAGNAITSGAGAYDSQMAQGRGLAVLTKADAVAYQEMNNQTLAVYSAADRLTASPFDTSNPHTFVGAIAKNLMPYITNTSPSSIVASVLGSLSHAVASLQTNTKAQSTIEEFSQCDDPDYAKKDIAADPFCNVKYGISPNALNKDPETVLEELVAGGHVDEETGQPKSEAFQNFIETCVDRTNSIGGYSDDQDSDSAKGYHCIQGQGEDEALNTNFRLYLIDKSIIDEMEDEPEATPESTNDTSAGDTGTLTAGGMSEAEGRALMNTYIRERSQYLSAATVSQYPNECVTFVKYFLSRYVDKGFSSGALGNGRYVVSNLLKATYNRGKTFGDGGHTPKLYAVASYPPGVGSASNGPYGHTAIVIHVYDDGATLVAEAGSGFGSGGGTPRYTSITKISAAESRKATYAYTDGILHGLEGAGGDTGGSS